MPLQQLLSCSSRRPASPKLSQLKACLICEDDPSPVPVFVVYGRLLPCHDVSCCEERFAANYVSSKTVRGCEVSYGGGAYTIGLGKERPGVSRV